MKTHTLQVLVAVAALTGVLAAAPAEARPCRKLCRRNIAENIVEHCSVYSGVIKRMCRKDVRTTIINYCQRQTGAGCYGN